MKNKDKPLNLDENTKQTATVASLFFLFLKIGLFTFGGGYVMIPLMQRELVDRKKLLDSSAFLDTLSLIQGLPGPIALNCAIMTSRRLRGIPGGFAAAAGLITPSVIIILTIVSFLLPHIEDNYYVNAAFHGIRPAVTALVAAAVWNMGKELLSDKMSILMFIFILGLGLFLKAHPVYLLLLGILAGWLYYCQKGDDHT